MPRFIGRPVVVEAWEFSGSIQLWPESFQRVVRRHLGNGTVEILTGGEARVCRIGDWVVRGGDGAFVVLHPSAFEASFEELPVAAEPIAAAPVAAVGGRRR